MLESNVLKHSCLQRNVFIHSDGTGICPPHPTHYSG